MKKLLLTVFVVFVFLLGTLPAKAAGEGDGGGGNGGVCRIYAFASAPVATNGTLYWAAGVPGLSTVNNYQFGNVQVYFGLNEWSCSQQMASNANVGRWDQGAWALVFPQGGILGLSAYFDNYLVDYMSGSLTGGGGSGGDGTFGY